MRRVAATLALINLLVLQGDAQPSQPIYLQYDGFVKNSNGTFILSFGYWNTNQVDVTIPPGPDNGFTPGPADRSQPIAFRKGQHRFVCTMVVGPDWDPTIKWTVRFAGHAFSTTSKPNLGLYELEEGSMKRATAGLDLATARLGACTNRAPSVGVADRFELRDQNAGAREREATSFTTLVDQTLNLRGIVEDDGLPRGSVVTTSWRKVSGLGTVSFSGTTTPITSVKFGAPGEYELELSATDGERNNSVKIKVTVNPAAG